MRRFTLSKPERLRYSAIIRELSDLSRHGWTRATWRDWQPLETELAALSKKMCGER